MRNEEWIVNARIPQRGFSLAGEVKAFEGLRPVVFGPCTLNANMGHPSRVGGSRRAQAKRRHSVLDFVGSWLVRGGGFLGIDELPNLCPFLIDFGHVLRAEFLIDVEFLLCAILLAKVYIVLSQAVMCVGKIRV